MSTSTCPVSTIAWMVSSRCDRSNRAIRRDAQDLERIEPPRTGGHHPDERDVVVRVGDRPQRLLEVADLGRRRTGDSPPTTVYGMSSSRSRATIASRCLCLRYRTATSGPACARSPRPTIALMASTIATASSSAPAQTTSSTGSPSGRVGREALVGLEPGLVVGDEPVGGGQDVPDRAEVLLDPEARRRAGRRRRPGRAPAAARTARRTRRRPRSWRRGTGRSTGRRRRRP